MTESKCLVTLQKGLDQFMQIDRSTIFDRIKIRELFSAFKVEYDGQVHVSRQQLEIKRDEYQKRLDKLSSEGRWTQESQSLSSAISVLNELLEPSEHHFLTVSEAREKLKEISKEIEK